MKPIFWSTFPFWAEQTFVSAEYKEQSPPQNIRLLNDINPLPNFVVEIGDYEADTSFISQYFAGNIGFDLDSSFARNIGFLALTGMIFL